MKHFAAAAAFLVAVSPSLAQTAVAPRAGAAPLETFAEVSIAGSSGIAEGSRALGDISGFSTRVGAIRTLALDERSAWLVGVSCQRFEFRPPAGAPIPHDLTALALKFGYNRQLDARWSLRAEIDPGLYSDLRNIGGGDFSAPIGLRLVRASSRELQWLFGLNIDPRSGSPILGGAGVRWQITPDVLLLAVVPTPRIEWTVSRDVTLFAAANLRSGAFRVGPDFGSHHARPALDGLIVDYREISAGAGARWQLSPGVALNAAAGWMFDRRFEFHARHLLLNGDGAATAQLTLTGAF
jgi:hypothetical protein